MPNENKVAKLQRKIQGASDVLKEAEIDKNGLTLGDVRNTLFDRYGFREMFNCGGADFFRVALRREGWARRRVSRRWFFEG